VLTVFKLCSDPATLPLVWFPDDRLYQNCC
jgi:hypothetical protein